MRESERRHWVFRAHVVDRAGALTSIASAFSNEGISIDTVVGHGVEKTAGVDGSVVLTCYCDEERIGERSVRSADRFIECQGGLDARPSL